MKVLIFESMPQPHTPPLICPVEFVNLLDLLGEQMLVRLLSKCDEWPTAC